MSYIFSILNLYLLRQFLGWFSVCIGSILSVVSIFEGAELLRRSIGRHVNLSTLLEMVLLKIPNHFQMLLPFAVLLATIVVFVRLNRSSELTVARSSGLSIWHVMSSFIQAVTLITVAHLVFINPLGAAMSLRLNNLQKQYFTNHPNRIMISETGLWLREANTQRHSIVHASHVEPGNRIFRGVNFYNYTPDGHYISRIYANKVTLKGGAWVLEQVKSWDVANKKTESDTLFIETSMTLEKLQEAQTPPENLSFWQLPSFIEVIKWSGLSGAKYLLHFHKLLAEMLFMIGMVLLAAGFCFRYYRVGSNLPVIAIGIAAGFGIYFASHLVYALGLGGKLPVAIAAWSPALMTVLISIARLFHIENG